MSKLDLSMGKRNFINSRGLKKLIYLYKKGEIYYDLSWFCFLKLNGKFPEEDELKFTKVGKNRIKEKCSIKKLKHYDSISENNKKKIRKITRGLKCKCNQCGVDTDFSLINGLICGLCKDCGEALIEWLDS